MLFTDRRRTATRGCRTRKRAVHVYSPGVAATRNVYGPPLLHPLQQHCSCFSWCCCY